jgi:hypothetical protein
VKELPAQRAGQTPALIRYRLHLKEAGIQVAPEAPARLLAQETLPFQRPREKHTQSVDLRPALADIRVDEAGDLIVDVRPAARGSARPLEVLSLLAQQPLESLKKVRMTKLLMELQAPKPLSAEAVREREVLLQRLSQQETATPPNQPIPE